MIFELLRDKDKDVWTRLHFLMDHDEDRRKEEMYWKMFQVFSCFLEYCQVRLGCQSFFSDLF